MQNYHVSMTVPTTATSNNVTWYSAEDLAPPYSIIVTNADGTWPAGDVIQVRASNAVTKPAASVTGFLVAEADGADEIITVTQTFRWIAAIKSAADASPEAQTCMLFAHKTR